MDWSCFPFPLNLRCYLWWLGEDFVDVHQLVKFLIAGIRTNEKWTTSTVLTTGFLFNSSLAGVNNGYGVNAKATHSLLSYYSRPILPESIE
jgi:hypothetical protein